MNAQQLKNSILQELFLPNKNWEEKDLKDIVDKQCPISYGIVQQGNHIDGGVPVVRPVDLHCKYVGREFLKCTSSQISDSYKRTILRGDELLLCVRGTTGIIALATKELEGCNVNRGIVPIFFNNDIDRLFIYYQLQTPKVQETIATNTMGSALRQINIKDLRTIKLVLPPLAEQHRIVAKIEELMPMVEEYGKAQEALDKLNAELPEKLKKSILQEAIEGRLVPQDPNDEPVSVLLDKIRKEKAQLVKEGKLKKKDLISEPITDEEKPFEIPENWEWVRLQDLVSLISDGTHKTPTYKETGVPFLSVQNISSGILSLERIKYISEEEHQRLCERVKPQRGDILVCRIGTLGKAIEITWDFDFSIFVSLGLLRPTNMDITPYMILFINSPAGKEWIDKVKVGGGTHTYKINLSDLPNMLIPLPPLTEQHRIVAKIEELFAGIDKLKTK